jgi:FMN reductase
MGDMSATTFNAVGISGSPAARSKSRTLLERALSTLAERGVARRSLTCPLSGRRASPTSCDRGRERAWERRRATIIVASTPVYRATYSGLLKVFFDLLPLNGLVGKTAIPIATGGSPAHQLVIDHGLRPLFASVGAVTTPTGVYGTDSAFENGVPHESLIARLDAAITEAITLSERIHVPTDSSSSTFVES